MPNASVNTTGNLYLRSIEGAKLMATRFDKEGSKITLVFDNGSVLTVEAGIAPGHEDIHTYTRVMLDGKVLINK